MTPLGETFAEASIRTRKEIFAGRLRRLPIIQWLLFMLEASDAHRLEYDVMMTALELDLPPVEAERQLNVITSWGRYAELLSFDAASGTIFLEATGAEAQSSGIICGRIQG